MTWERFNELLRSSVATLSASAAHDERIGRHLGRTRSRPVTGRARSTRLISARPLPALCLARRSLSRFLFSGIRRRRGNLVESGDGPVGTAGLFDIEIQTPFHVACWREWQKSARRTTEPAGKDSGSPCCARPRPGRRRSSVATLSASAAPRRTDRKTPRANAKPACDRPRAADTAHQCAPAH
jgi:hypothetical protein